MVAENLWCHVHGYLPMAVACLDLDQGCSANSSGVGRPGGSGGCILGHKLGVAPQKEGGLKTRQDMQLDDTRW